MVFIIVGGLIGFLIGGIAGGAPFGPIGSIFGSIVGGACGMGLGVLLQLFVGPAPKRPGPVSAAEPSHGKDPAADEAAPATSDEAAPEK